MLDSDSSGFDLDLLSAREGDILRHAAEGQTDAEIARLMGITVSTVNSYWVRVRGKLGQQSRTELVARMIRWETRRKLVELRSENRRLMEALQKARASLQDSIDYQNALRTGAWPFSALVHLPEAVLVTEPPATVVFGNRAAYRLYRAEPGELAGLPMRELTLDGMSEGLREPCRTLFEEDGPERELLGVGQPFYAVRRDRTNFRAALKAERFASDKRPYAAVTVREFLEDVDALVASIRQPFGLE